MAMCAGFRASDPAGLAGLTPWNESIGANGNFDLHERAALGDAANMADVYQGAFLTHHADVNFDPRRPQPRNTGTGNAHVRVLDANHHTSKTRRDDSIRARTSAANMRARLQRDVKRCTTSACARECQRVRLSMWTATRLCPTLSDDDLRGSINDHRTNTGVRRSGTKPALRHLQGRGHEGLIGGSV
jgi:hypothetical protein